MKPHKHAELIKANLHRFEYKYGGLYWKDGRRAGRLAGSVDSRGYIQIKLSGVPVFAHRIVWMIFNDTHPEQIDHINRERVDNDIRNLRPATNMTNQHNAGMRKDNSSGCVGVHNRKGKWQARIQYGGKRVHLGTFKTAIEATKAYQKAKETYHG